MLRYGLQNSCRQLIELNCLSMKHDKYNAFRLACII